MTASEHLSPNQFKSYTKHYNAGWRHSSTASDPDLDNGIRYSARQAAKGEDREFAHTAWEDGYMDSAVGRDKYDLRGHRFGTKDLSEWGY